MSSVVEEAIKVLAAFEAELDGVKLEATEAKKRLMKVAVDQGEKARDDALAKARSVAEQRIRNARRDAEAEAAVIVEKGRSSLVSLNARISEKSDVALELITKHLLGD